MDETEGFTRKKRRWLRSRTTFSKPPHALKTVSIEADKLSATYDFTPAPEAEVVLAATIDGGKCKGTWILREKAGGTTAAQGTWSVAKK